MKIIVGCPVKDRAWCLPEWFAGIKAQELDVELACVYTDSNDETLHLLHDYGVHVIVDESKGRPTNEIDGHMWGQAATYAYMGKIRNRLLTYAQRSGADYFLSLDSDIVLPPNALKTMIEATRFIQNGAMVAPAVSMIPNGECWNVMHWNPDKYEWAMRLQPEQENSGKADVIMAAILFDRMGMRVRWRQHNQGEDIGLCVDAKRKGVLRVWLKEIQCRHLMQRPASP